MELVTPIITIVQIMNPNLNTITLHKGFGWMISIILFVQPQTSLVCVAEDFSSEELEKKDLLHNSLADIIIQIE